MINLEAPRLRNRGLALLCTLVPLVFFLGGILNHALPFAGLVGDNRTPLWHGYNTVLAMSGIFALLSKRKLGLHWLFTIFIAQWVVEARGTFMLRGMPAFGDQLFETIFVSMALAALWYSRGEYQQQ
jgi:hypothetical protein